MTEPAGKILIVASMPKTSFSGGRYHTLMLAKCLAREGYRVEILTNNFPQMWGELEGIPDFGKVKFSVSATFDLQSLGEAKVDHILCIPDLGWTRSFSASLESKLKYRASLTLLNFESPNWFNSLSEFQRPWYLWWPWWITSMGSDRILSSTNEGNRFAKKYFWLASKKSFRSIPAPINTFALTQALKSSSVRNHGQASIFIPTRIRGGDHKGVHEFQDILALVPAGTRISILSDEPENPILKNLSTEFSARGVELRLLTGVSEIEKFENYLAADITLFPSKFEGFGYPPIESIASGTPVLAYGLNVFRETLGDLVLSVDSRSPAALAEALCEILDKGRERISVIEAETVARKYSPESVASQLSNHFQSITRVSRSSFLMCRFSLLLLAVLSTLRGSLVKFRKWSLKFAKPNRSI